MKNYHWIDVIFHDFQASIKLEMHIEKNRILYIHLKRIHVISFHVTSQSTSECERLHTYGIDSEFLIRHVFLNRIFRSVTVEGETCGFNELNLSIERKYLTIEFSYANGIFSSEFYLFSVKPNVHLIHFIRQIFAFHLWEMCLTCW